MMILGAASEFWMTRALTAFWILGVGVAAGLLVLLLLIGLFKVLSTVDVLESWRRSGVAFWITLGLATIATALASGPLYRTFPENENRTEEWSLVLIALWPILAIVCGAFVYCGQKRFMGEIWGTLSRGVGAMLLSAAIGIAAIGLLCTPIVDEPFAMLASVPSLFTTGETKTPFTLKPADESGEGTVKPYQLLPFKYDSDFVDSITVESNRTVLFADAETPEGFFNKPVRIEAQTPYVWNRKSNIPAPITLVKGASVYAQNIEIDDATIAITMKTVAPYPEVFAAFVFAGFTVFFGLVWMLMQAAAPKLSAIAMATAKSELSQPLPVLLMAIGIVFILAFIWLPFHTEGEDIKLLKDCGLTLILIIALFQGVWSASSTVSEEIEGRTALTLLSKPIRRRSFILGKMLGIFWVLTLIFLILGPILLMAVGYKPIYDAGESSQEMPLWQACHVEVVRTVPGLIMGLLQATTLSAVAVALATRVPQLANFAICFSIYLVGHLTPSIVSSSAEAFPIIQFIAQLIAVVVPTLDWYSMDKAIDTGNAIPTVYMAGILVYSILLTAFAVFLGLLLFEDRDLA